MFEENQDEEELSSEVLPRSILLCNNYYKKRHITYTYLDMYYTYISPNNAIQVCSPDPLLHSDFLTLFQNFAKGTDNDLFRRCWKSSMCFSFRNKFPKIAACCSMLPTLRSSVNINIFILKLRAYINGSKQFSSSCNYIFDTWYGGNPILWFDLQGKEGTFSEYVWNEAEILFELKYPTQRTREGWSTHNINLGNVKCTLIGVYKKGNNKEDIEFKDPI
ncbi:hypothetical protein VNO78_33084 [Psophocarpus tetragonolobus]|uniref:Uncharacterized protein n=1 Tax=Psophocarpus tetragonolobus TaxID=3891 RepID=A0AAN9RL14_PSOTE